MAVRISLYTSAAVGAILCLTSPALAQQGVSSSPAASTDTAESPAGSTDDAKADIVVTASRAGRSGYDAPTPTKVLGVATLQARGSTNVGDFLNEVPAFRPSQSVQTNPQQNSTAGQTYADLRGLGNIRTLTLVDGRRHVPSASTGQVDLNLIPTILVERIEVVTGGASAQWGSDAVAGVVNVILDKKLQGFKGDLSFGISDKGDDKERRGALAFGTSFADNRGHIVIGGEYVQSDGIDSYLERAWGRRSDELVSYVGARPADQPPRFYASGVGSINLTKGGLILGNNADTNPGNGADVLRGIQFGPGGTVLPYNYGTIVGTNSINNSASTPNGTTPLSIRDGLQLVTPLKRYTGLGHIDYDLTETVSAFIEFGYGRTGATYHSPPVRDSTPTGLLIKRDNAFLPAQIAAIMDANAITSFGLGRQFDDFGQVRANNYIESARGVAGLKGTFGSTYKWDVYVQTGRSQFTQQVSNLRIESNFLLAADSILVGGAAVCRDATARAAGCVALNPFGAGSPSAAAINYVTGNLFYQVVNREDVAAANLSGEPFSTWAGPVSIAVGAEYRKEKSTGISDKISQISGFNYGNPKSFAGSFNVKEGYLEAIVPLAKDTPFFKALDFNGAVRFTNYSTSGSVTTWKVGATWEPVEGLRFRGTHSRDIRAPNNSELFSITSTRGTLVNSFSGVNGQFTIISAASPTLKPEKADTTTAGAVFAPKFLPGFQASVDYFDIKVNGAISAYSAQLILDNCFAAGGTGFFCGFVDKSGSGSATIINSVTQGLVNLASVKTRGIDFEASYRFNLAGGRATTRVFGTYTPDLIVDDGLGIPVRSNAAGVVQTLGSVINYAGQVGGFTSGSNVSYTNTPKLVLNGTLGFETGIFSTTVQGRYVGGGKVNKAAVDPSSPLYNPLSPIAVLNNDVKGRFYVNLSAAVKVINDGTHKVEVYGVVNNLFDTEVPFPGTQVSGLYDRIGRFIRIGVRFSY
jgi:iron complex outermembrane receptor protein